MTDARPGHAPSEFCDTAGAAAFLNFRPSTLEEWRAKGTGPAYHRHGRYVRYTYADLREWMYAHRVDPQQVSVACGSDPIEVAQGSQTEQKGPSPPS